MGLRSQVERTIQVLRKSRLIVPEEIIANACGICVITEVKGALFFSAQVGRGLLLKRVGKGRFGYPSSVMCFGMGAGAQVGGEKIDHLLIINDEATMKVLEGSVQIRLGGEFSITTGPNGRDGQGLASLGTRGVTSFYSYSLSKGAFVGVSLEGSFFCQNHFANKSFYRGKYSVSDILDGNITLVGEAINVVEDFHVFLFEFVNGESTDRGAAILPLGEDEFNEVENSKEAQEVRRKKFLRKVRSSTRTNDDRRNVQELSSDNENEEAEVQEVAEEVGLLDISSNRIIRRQQSSAQFRRERKKKENLERLHQLCNQDETWLKEKLAHGPAYVLTCSHLVDESEPKNASHMILSVDIGDVVTLLIGDTRIGLPDPYGEYVVVSSANGRVGRVSKFCLEPYSSNPFPFQTIDI